MLQVTADDVENIVFEGKAVAETTFVSNSSDQYIKSLSDVFAFDSAHIGHESFFNKNDQEHLVHRNVTVLRVNVVESLFYQENFKLLNARIHFLHCAFLSSKENQVEVLHTREESFQLLLAEEIFF